jgi:hypothetical protein
MDTYGSTATWLATVSPKRSAIHPVADESAEWAREGTVNEPLTATDISRLWFGNVTTPYEKSSTFLRNELVSNNLNDFGLRKGLDHLNALRTTLRATTDRFAELPRCRGCSHSSAEIPTQPATGPTVYLI